MKRNCPFVVQTLLTTAILFFSGCSGTYKHSVSYNPLEPLRVAVLPFAFVDASGEPIAPPGGLAIDAVPLISSQASGTPNQIVQSAIQSQLSKTALDVVLAPLVEAQLSHNGFYEPHGGPLYKKIFATTPQALCSQLLQCDALLYGRVSRWDRTYLGLESRNSVSFDVTLVSAKDGSVLYSAHAEDSDSRGLSKGPTGISDLVIAPVKGLDTEVIAGLAERMAFKAIEPLTLMARPEYLATPPPAIFGSAADIQADGFISPGTPLTVVMLGTPQGKATFSIGTAVVNIPMVERDPSHYYGQFIALQSDTFAHARISVAITDPVGRRVEQFVGPLTVSTKPHA